MLFALYPTITQNYYLFVFVICLGTLQWAAARTQTLSLSPLGPLGLGQVGIFTGISLIVAGFTWFFIATPGLFDEGLAGGELTTLFATGGFSALLVARLCGMCWQRLQK